ncbi:MAG: sporulation protein YqfD [Anaerolineaceae bacterium]|nr:MAG: sporulation protein YqfD [Anaerolineaceae bacterium]
MLRKLKHWLFGYLTVHISGISPERFINLCSNRRLYIWNIVRDNEQYRFNLSARNYKKLKPIFRKTRLIPKIKEKHGLPFFLHRNRRRKGFFIGILICVILVYIMSLYIWDINILGGSKYTPEAILKFLAKSDIKAGIKKKKINGSKIEENIRLAYADIGWVSAEIRGTRLIIKITETNMPVPVVEATAPSHILASKPAVVKEIVTRSGTPMVKPGDVVKEGDILVSGVLNVMDDFGGVLEKKPVIASADIVCSSYYDYYDSFSLNHIDRIFTDNKKTGYYITLFGKKIILYNPRYSYSMYDIIVNENTTHITDSFYLPFQYGSITIREYFKQKDKYTEEEAIDIAKSRLKRYFDKLTENGVYISRNNVTIEFKNNMCIAQGRIFVEEPAWEYKIVDESEWRINQTDEHNGDNN